MTPVIAPVERFSAVPARAASARKAKNQGRKTNPKARLTAKSVAIADGTAVTVSAESKKANRTKPPKNAKVAKKIAKSRQLQAVNGTARRVNGSAKQKLNGHSNGLKSTLATPANGHSNGATVIDNDAGTKPRNSVRKGNGSAAAPGKNTGSEVTVNTPSSDRKLIDQALGGVAGAWDVLYHRCHQPLLTAIRAIVGPRSADPNLVDELAARVWYAVVRDQGRLLDRFDPRRECTLTTYLALIAKDEASRFFRSEKRRRKRETAVATCDNKSASKSTSVAGSTTITIHEFVATLTPAEKTFYDEITARNSHAANGVNGSNGAEKANGAGHTNGRSQANEWQLNHRVRRKLERFLTN
jgi:DNA-directed RNA polymerase specialized sigma24 family protein